MPRPPGRAVRADRGLAAVLHGSPLPTVDADICPLKDHENLERLAAALEKDNPARHGCGGRARRCDSFQGSRKPAKEITGRCRRCASYLMRFGSAAAPERPDGPAWGRFRLSVLNAGACVTKFVIAHESKGRSGIPNPHASF